MGQIKVEKNVGGIDGLCVIMPTVHGDGRGYFMETYNQKEKVSFNPSHCWSLSLRFNGVPSSR